MNEAVLSEARRSFHATLLASVLYSDTNDIPSNADRDNKLSVSIAGGILA